MNFKVGDAGSLRSGFRIYSVSGSATAATASTVASQGYSLNPIIVYWLTTAAALKIIFPTFVAISTLLITLNF